MAGKMNNVLRNQSGAALVIALIMIIVITLIALASSYTSIYEIKISGNKRGMTDAFYAADGGVNAIVSDPVDNFAPNKYTQNKPPGWEQNAPTASYNPFPSTTSTNNPTGINPADATCTFYMNVWYPPRGGGYSANAANYKLFKVQCTGRGSANCPATLEEDVMLIVPNKQ